MGFQVLVVRFARTLNKMTMKTIPRKILKWLGGTILTMLGFASCTTTPADDLLEAPEPVDLPGQYISMYGVPTSAFKVSGTVKGQGGTKLNGIQVVSVFGESTWMRTDTTYTDSSGKFSSSMRTYPADKVQLIFNDIDGSRNGGDFESQTVALTPRKVGDGDGAWFQGTYEVTASVTLKKK